MGAKPISVQTVDSAHRPHEAKFWLKDEIAVIEAAQVNGLAMLPPGKFHPFELDTFGLGKVFESATEVGAEKALVGIGGSSTNDGGFGLARALGWRFFDERGWQPEKWTDLDCIHTCAAPENAFEIEVTVAVDVQNPLLGPLGASRVYGPQKGLRQEDMTKAEASLGRLAQVVGRGIADEPGTGAAGGLGFGLRAFMNGKFVSGADLFAQAANLDERLKTTDLLISGEGAIDAQSLMGKGVGSLFDRAKRAGVKRLGLAGILGSDLRSTDPELQLLSIVPGLANPEDAKQNAAHWLAKLAAQAAKKYEV